MFEQFKNTIGLEEDKWQDYSSCFKRMQVPAKTSLLKEGQISKKLFLIEKGCMRAWYNNNGREITLQFFFENDMVSSIESFRNKLPSLVALDTIEPSVIWWIHKKDLDRIIDEITESKELRDKFIDALFRRIYVYMKHFFSFIKDTPAQRYLNLIREKPQIISRIPQHYIASYLGISAVHLSRIKNISLKKRKPSGI